MNIKKNLVKNTIEYFKNKSSKIPSSIFSSSKEEQFKAYDKERELLKDLLKTAGEDKSSSAKNFASELNRSKALSYVNTISEREDLHKIQENRNLADEVNQKFDIKKVEGNKRSKRSGLLGYKVGMMTVWDKFGVAYPLSVIKIENCQVTQVKSKETDNYNAIQVGVGSRSVNNAKKPMIGHFIKNDVPIKRDVKEFMVSPENFLPVGYALSARHFSPGQLVDVKGISKGKGWQGVMHRWNFAGGFASHGCSIKHRGGGSIGNREKPGKVWKGKKMAGQMGNEKMTVQHLIVYRIDHERNLLFVKGSIPGNVKSLVSIQDSPKKVQPEKLHFPTFIPDKGKTYPNIFEWTDTQDLNEKYTHDNDEILGISDEEEEGEAEKGVDDDATVKK